LQLDDRFQHYLFETFMYSHLDQCTGLWYDVMYSTM